MVARQIVLIVRRRQILQLVKRDIMGIRMVAVKHVHRVVRLMQAIRHQMLVRQIVIIAMPARLRQEVR